MYWHFALLFLVEILHTFLFLGKHLLNPSLCIEYPPDLDSIPHTPTGKFSHSL